MFLDKLVIVHCVWQHHLWGWRSHVTSQHEASAETSHPWYCQPQQARVGWHRVQVDWTAGSSQDWIWVHLSCH